MKTYTAEELSNILELHKKWLNDDGGERANLLDANLRGANLRGANLWGANLRGANLWGANLLDANLLDANLCGANLCGANLERANLLDANLLDANLLDANLLDANLCGANLERANLLDANLRGAIGNLTHVKSLQCEKYFVTYTAKVLQIGCQRFTIEEWKNFDDEKIKGMDSGALEWWTKWKPIIMQIIEMSPCEPTKDEQ